MRFKLISFLFLILLVLTFCSGRRTPRTEPLPLEHRPDEISKETLPIQKPEKETAQPEGDPGVEIKVEDGDVTLDLQILVRFGMNIPDAARQVQETIKSAVDKTLDINLKDINVNVQGIEKAGPGA